MPANLTPEYRDAEKRYRTARTLEEKLACLEEMLTKIPKHKGTDKMQADIKRRIARTRETVDQRARRKKGFSRKVVKEGAGQIALAGPPNVGKSRLLTTLTHAKSEVADYPFTTHEPVPGMMSYKDVQVQLLDLPPISTQHMEPWLSEVIKSADAAALIVDASSHNTLLERIEETLDRMKHIKAYLAREADSSLPFNVTHLPALIAANKIDLTADETTVKMLSELYGDRFDVVSCSSTTGTGLDELRERLFSLLNVIRVYTKTPGKKQDEGPPYTIRHGSTIMDFAEIVHKDFAEGLRYARVWGSGKFQGQQVPRDYILSDEDIVELHM